jgi:hypothetical protein
VTDFLARKNTGHRPENQPDQPVWRGSVSLTFALGAEGETRVRHFVVYKQSKIFELSIFSSTTRARLLILALAHANPGNNSTTNLLHQQSVFTPVSEELSHKVCRVVEELSPERSA